MEMKMVITEVKIISEPARSNATGLKNANKGRRLLSSSSNFNL
jgi:hypothetical protein